MLFVSVRDLLDQATGTVCIQCNDCHEHTSHENIDLICCPVPYEDSYNDNCMSWCAMFYAILEEETRMACFVIHPLSLYVSIIRSCFVDYISLATVV